jgi:hypothetical protein
MKPRLAALWKNQALPLLKIVEQSEALGKEHEKRAKLKKQRDDVASDLDRERLVVERCGAGTRRRDVSLRKVQRLEKDTKDTEGQLQRKDTKVSYADLSPICPLPLAFWLEEVSVMRSSRRPRARYTPRSHA